MMSRYYSADQAEAYNAGMEEARRAYFRHTPGDINQMLFRAETQDHKFTITYDDVECGIELNVTFKNRWKQDDTFGPINVGVSVRMRSLKDAMARVGEFIARHPGEEPYCSVDY